MRQEAVVRMGRELAGRFQPEVNIRNSEAPDAASRATAPRRAPAMFVNAIDNIGYCQLY